MKNCIGWTFSPLPQVESPVGNLLTTSSVLDVATKTGCKAQSYTSWDCMSRCYVGGVYISEGDKIITPTHHLREFRGDKPTKEDMVGWNRTQKILYEQGKKVFVKGKGLMTKHQFSVWKQGQKGLASGSDRPTTRAQTQIVNSQNNNLGFYYSDIKIAGQVLRPASLGQTS